MTTLDISTEDWSLWELVVTTPSGWPMTYRVRAASEGEAIRKLTDAKGPHWSLARDANDVPLIWRVWRP